MAIADMLALKLVGINAKQNEILDVLHSTGAVEISLSNDFEGLSKVTTDKSEIKNKKERVENALSIIAERCKQAKVEESVKDGFGVNYEEFTSISSKEEQILAVCDKAKELNELIHALNAEIIAIRGEIEYFEPYLGLADKFSDFKGTKTTACKLGIVEKRNAQRLIEKLGEIELADAKIVSEGERSVAVRVIVHLSALEECERVLIENSFIRSTKEGEFTAKEKVDELTNIIKAKRLEIQKAKEEIINLASNVRDLKVLSDNYSFQLEKLGYSDNFERTKNTFYLSGFVPKEAKERVEKALEPFSEDIYKEFKELEEGEFAPTLMKNNKVVSNFEFVTNLYSVPQYKEYDPNAIMGFFFSIFLGFITADAGYGILMLLGGLLFNLKSKRKTGINKLAGVIAMAGIATILFGIGFDSWLGLPLLRSIGLMKNTLLPDPVAHTSMLAGISIPTLLLIALGMGVVHIMASLCVLAWTHFRKGRILDGICDGIIWAIFLAGLILFVLCQMGTVKGLDNVAIGLLLGSVVLGAVTAGRHAKGFGKFTKGFGAVYGLINYMSDILSYARLYGLMLSGAKIAEIFSQQLAVPMLESPGGVAGVIACVVIMLVGHLFNIAMGVLGAFIHDARLQYVEFFSHFYNGDGELFTPIGSKFEHIYLDK
ncbi:MAG: hypothetical protein IJA15_03865 [Clostridia bacterium]|nr:hypothetical protein [Clostridia bacterium]